jgi:hypothetical protein
VRHVVEDGDTARVHRTRQGDTNDFRHPQRPVRISKPFARRHSSLCYRLVTSPNAASSVSGVGTATPPSSRHSWCDSWLERRRKPRNPTHFVSVSGVGEVVSEGDLNDAVTRILQRRRTAGNGREHQVRSGAFHSGTLRAAGRDDGPLANH